MKTSAAVLTLSFLTATAHAADWTLTPIWATPAEFQNPESVIYDRKRDIFYVSNVNGQAGEKDGNGFISQLDPGGVARAVQWVSGLDAPKGMGISGDKLYVADIGTLVEIDLGTGAVSNRYAAPGAKFLNDVTVDENGNVYVSDMMTNTIHRLSGGTIEVWLGAPELENPNGLYADGDKLYVGCWGVMQEGFATLVPGRIKVVSLKDKSIADFGSGKPIGNMDGIELLAGGSVLATDWMAGSLLVVSPSGEVSQLADLNQGSADLEYVADKKLAVVPMMSDNTVVAYRLDGKE